MSTVSMRPFGGCGAPPLAPPTSAAAPSLSRTPPTTLHHRRPTAPLDARPHLHRLCHLHLHRARQPLRLASSSSLARLSPPTAARGSTDPPEVNPSSGATTSPMSRCNLSRLPMTLRRKARTCLGLRSVSCTQRHMVATRSSMARWSCLRRTTSLKTMATSSPPADVVSFILPPAPALLPRRLMSCRRWVWPCRNDACVNSH